MQKSVYIETSIISYLTAKPSRDLTAAAWQQITTQWWEQSRPNYNLFTSELVFIEAERGDADAAAKRITCLKGIPELQVNDEIEMLAERFLLKGGLPHKAEIDSLHIAIAAVHQMDYILTWNCRHINNAALKPLLRSVCIAAQYPFPEICTPMELLPEVTENVPG